MVGVERMGWRGLCMERLLIGTSEDKEGSREDVEGRREVLKDGLESSSSREDV